MAEHVRPEDRVCGNCAHCFPLTRQPVGPGRECRRQPPQVMYLPLAGPGVVGGPPAVNWISNSAYPPVGVKTPACGAFALRVEVVN